MKKFFVVNIALALLIPLTMLYLRLFQNYPEITKTVTALAIMIALIGLGIFGQIIENKRP